MKSIILKSFSVVALVLLSFSLMSMDEATSKRPFIGTTSSNETVPCGECMCTYTTTTQYIFWINVGSSTELTGTRC